MCVVSVGGLCFSGFAWTFKFLQSKHIETTIQHAWPCTSAFNGPAWGLRTMKVNCEIILCSSISQSRISFVCVCVYMYVSEMCVHLGKYSVLKTALEL
jgi:hypothetical protein